MNNRYFAFHLHCIHWVFKHGLDEDGEPVAEEELGDEEPAPHRPHQPQQVEGVEAGLARHAGLAHPGQLM